MHSKSTVKVYTKPHLIRESSLVITFTGNKIAYVKKHNFQSSTHAMFVTDNFKVTLSSLALNLIVYYD